jgi:hypothetical protein
VRVVVDTYDDDAAPVCVRFDNRGFRLTTEEAERLRDALSAAVRDLRAGGEQGASVLPRPAQP